MRRRLFSSRVTISVAAARASTRRGHSTTTASFADIFFTNSLKNGLLPIVLPESAIDRLFEDVKAFPGFMLTIDLERQIVATTDGATMFGFDIEPFAKHCLVNGLDEIGLTLQHADAIRAFEARHMASNPWFS